MSKPRKNHSKETFEPKIGFENCGDKELSFSFSELDLQGNAPKANSFFSDSDREVAETPQEESQSVEPVNDSNGLNHAFFEENSESLSIQEPVKISKEINENVETTNVKALHRSESENSDINEIILSNTEAPLKVENQPKTQPVARVETSSRKKKGCCKCANCYIF